ncbi:MAG: aminotransferase class I/II-fold pyridoxal phosphate-dependent enzyme [Gammaproteobacteria bacterium]|nr:aminotransferase class I/II-fold pyridoxal phosphate-dependent enzyme [Gammaproteobacteria bacterium]
MLKAANRMHHIAPFYVMDLLAQARKLEAQGRDIVHMEIGEPDFPTPAPIINAGIAALAAGKTHYTPAVGLPALRDALANYYDQHYDCKVESQNIVITPGSSGALQLVISVLVNPGEEVLMTEPGYPCNKHFVELAGGQAKFIELSQQDSFSISLEQVKQAWTSNTKAIMLASPSNPTGEIISDQTLLEIAQFARSKNGFLIVDEIYQGLEYDVSLQSMAGKLDNIFVINSFSKFFCMTGWRLGWLVAPAAFVESIDILAQNIFLAAPTAAQYAALAAFSNETMTILEEYRIAFQARRDYLYEAVSALGFGVGGKPKGAFYIYADSSRFATDSYKLCFELLEKAGVAITPGKDFSKANPEKYVRFAYTRDIAELEKGIDRISSFMA